MRNKKSVLMTLNHNYGYFSTFAGIAGNVFGLGEGGLVGCSNLAECVCPLLPNPCYGQYGLLIRNYQNQNENK